MMREESIVDLVIINDKIFKSYDEMYYVSCDGEVYSTYRNKKLKWDIDKDGYPRVDIHCKPIKIHKLVYMVWGSRDLGDKQINHRDDNKLNPHIENLYLGDQKQNIQDSIRNGTRVGNVKCLIVYDKVADKQIEFTPANKFREYCGHSALNGSVKGMFNRDWFKERYEVIKYCNSLQV